ncbi:MAG TPA: sugar phosphate isomerase/epimerase family protein [Lacipirellulaceae bacterium]|jgi:sugar phosphate isomerase/epimerase|nr:sugar phosphate isomerase/epimerase family protein [Lacipirellulaceae bacterium]
MSRPDPSFKISLAEWSFHRALEAREMDNLDFPIIAKREFDIDCVEYVNTFFKDHATDRRYLQELKQRCDDHGVRSGLIMCDHEGDLGDPTTPGRIAAVENHFKWVEAAKFLGCDSIRVNARSVGGPQEQLRHTADGLARLCAFAAPHNINVLVENHGGLSSNGRWLADVIKAVIAAGHRNCGTLPDFGNFTITPGEIYDRYQGVAEMMPFAKGVSAKSRVLDATGNEAEIDYERMLKIVLDASYRGYVGIEYSGPDLSESEGVRQTKNLLIRTRDKLGNP